MIRMGRGSKDAETNDYPTQNAAEQSYRYSNEPTPTSATPRAISESDSMARDIKEGRLSGFVGHGTTLTGETDFQAMLRVDGLLVGTVSSASGTLIVGTNGQVDANVAVAAAMINGTVNGDIIATEKLHLGRTARVMGNIQAPRLVIEEGALLEGSCSMLRAIESRDNEAATQAAPDEDEVPTYSTSNYGATGDEQASFLLDDTDDEESAETARA
jgi:cytoskeletal protein CcmA (bactofilin family)